MISSTIFHSDRAKELQKFEGEKALYTFYVYRNYISRRSDHGTAIFLEHLHGRLDQSKYFPHNNFLQFLKTHCKWLFQHIPHLFYGISALSIYSAELL